MGCVESMRARRLVMLKQVSTHYFEIVARFFTCSCPRPPVMPMRELPGRSGHLDAATAHAMRRHVKAGGRPRPRRACLRDASPTTAAGAIIRRRRPRCRERAKPCTTDPNCSRKRDAWRAANASIAVRHVSNHGIAAGSAARFRAGDGRGTRHRPARAEPVDLLSCIASASRCLMSASCPARDAHLATRRHRRPLHATRNRATVAASAPAWLCKAAAAAVDCSTRAAFCWTISSSCVTA